MFREDCESGVFSGMLPCADCQQRAAIFKASFVIAGMMQRYADALAKPAEVRNATSQNTDQLDVAIFKSSLRQCSYGDLRRKKIAKCRADDEARIPIFFSHYTRLHVNSGNDGRADSSPKVTHGRKERISAEAGADERQHVRPKSNDREFNLQGTR